LRIAATHGWRLQKPLDFARSVIPRCSALRAPARDRNSQPSPGIAAIDGLHLTIAYALEIRTSLDETHPVPSGQDSNWHNGYFIAV
jgi:hypothetical protein